MKDTIQGFKNKLALLERFANKYDTGEKLPSEMLHASLSSVGAEVTIYAGDMHHGRGIEGREQILSAAGDLWGREDWTRELNYNKDGFNWCRLIDGVSVTIHTAETIANPLDKTKVKPSAFPLLLEYKPASLAKVAPASEEDGLPVPF